MAREQPFKCSRELELSGWVEVGEGAAPALIVTLPISHKPFLHLTHQSMVWDDLVHAHIPHSMLPSIPLHLLLLAHTTASC
jgi:hypothetical protein